MSHLPTSSFFPFLSSFFQMQRCSLLALPRGEPSSVNQKESAAELTAAAALVVKPTLMCRRCDTCPEFATVSELRSHFRSEHSFRPPAEGESEDDSSTTDDEGGAADADVTCDGEGEDRTPAGGPLVCVRFRDAGTRLVWVYRALLLTSPNTALGAAAAGLRGASCSSAALPIDIAFDDLIQPGETWAVFAFSSGYFMSSVWEITPPRDFVHGADTRTAAGRAPPSWPRCVLHKRHHRYTTRRKQGGSQSAHDAKGRPAKSVGAQMRRAGERHLLEDVHGLFTSAEWAPAIRHASRVVLAAPRRERPAFLAAAAPTLVKGDPRLFSPPFETGRPSLEVVTSIVRTLLSVAVPAASAAPAHAGAATTGEGPLNVAMPSAPAREASSARASLETRTCLPAAVDCSETDGHPAQAPLPAEPDHSSETRAAELADEALVSDDQACREAVDGTGDETRANDKTAPSGAAARTPAPQRKRNKGPAKRKGGGGGPAGRVAVAAAAVTAKGDASDVDALHAALVAVAEEQRVRDAQSGASELLRAARASVHVAVDEVATRTRVPAAAVAAALSVAGASPDVGAELQRLQALGERLSTVLALAAAGASPAQAFASVGLEGLAAAALVASSASVFVDWSQITSAAPPVDAGCAAGRGRADEELTAAVGVAQGRKGGKGRGKQHA